MTLSLRDCLSVRPKLQWSSPSEALETGMFAESRLTSPNFSSAVTRLILMTRFIAVLKETLLRGCSSGVTRGPTVGLPGAGEFARPGFDGYLDMGLRRRAWDPDCAANSPCCLGLLISSISSSVRGLDVMTIHRSRSACILNSSGLKCASRVSFNFLTLWFLDRT